MKQVKELSLVQSVRVDNNFVNELSVCHFASGFASVDFMIWNLKTEMKVCSPVSFITLVVQLKLKLLFGVWG